MLWLPPETDWTLPPQIWVSYQDWWHTMRYGKVSYIHSWGTWDTGRSSQADPKWPERARLGDWLGFTVAGVRVPAWGQGLVWFESPPGAKGGSTQALSVCQELGAQGELGSGEAERLPRNGVSLLFTLCIYVCVCRQKGLCINTHTYTNLLIYMHIFTYMSTYCNCLSSLTIFLCQYV